MSGGDEKWWRVLQVVMVRITDPGGARRCKGDEFCGQEAGVGNESALKKNKMLRLRKYTCKSRRPVRQCAMD